MRIHLKTLSNHHRVRIQLKRAYWDELVARGTVFQTKAVHRSVNGVTRLLPQRWYIHVLGRQLPLANLGYGWFETVVGRKADHFEDLTARALLLSIRPIVQKVCSIAQTPVAGVNEIRWGQPVERDKQKISRGLNPKAEPKPVATSVRHKAGQTITSKLYSEPPKGRPFTGKPPTTEKLEHLCARFNRTKDRA